MKKILVACGTAIATSTVVAKKLQEALEKRGLKEATRAFATVPSAFEAARGAAGPNDRIVVFGSFTTVAEALRNARN